MNINRLRPLLFAVLLALAFVAGGASPLQGGPSAEDALVRQIEKLTDAVKNLDGRKVECDCKCGG